MQYNVYSLKQLNVVNGREFKMPMLPPSHQTGHAQSYHARTCAQSPLVPGRTTLSPLNVASPPTPIQSIIVLYNLYIIIAASKAKSSCKIDTFLQLRLLKCSKHLFTATSVHEQSTCNNHKTYYTGLAYYINSIHSVHLHT